VKRSGRDKPIGVVIHMYMETTQRISLYSYLYLKLAKMPCFSNYVLRFFFYKIREQGSRRGSPQDGGVGHLGKGENGGERDRRVNKVQIMYTHECKCKKDVETIPGIRGWGMKESSGEGKFKYDIFDTL
jgi:hypothetical protein